MARNKNFPQNLQKLNRQIQHKINHVQSEGRDKKKTWTTFAYYSPKIRKITYSNTKTGIAFKNTIMLQQLTMLKTNTRTRQERNLTNFYATLAISHTSDRQAIVRN
jgi:hypothetical protein